MPKIAMNVLFRNHTTRLLAGGVMSCLLLLGLGWLTLRESWLEYQQRARVATQNVAQLVESEVSAILDRIDLGLHTAADEVERQHAAGGLRPAQLDAFLKRHHRHLPDIVSLNVVDERGLLRYGVGGRSFASAVAESDIFQRQQHGGAGLVVGQPVYNANRQEWVVPVSRRVNRRGGAFAGIVYADISSEHFARQFAQIDLGVDGVLVMRSSDHWLLARYPKAKADHPDHMRRDISDRLRGLLRSSPMGATYEGRSPVDGIERIFTYRKLERYPMYVIVGMGLPSRSAEWRRDVVQVLLLLAVFVGLTLAFFFHLHRSWTRQIQQAEELRRNGELWSFALESGGYAVWDWDIVNGTVGFSKRGKRLFGFEDDEIGDHIALWADRCYPADMKRVRVGLREHFRGRAPNLVCDVRVRDKHGNWIWVLLRGLIVKRNKRGRPLRMIGLLIDISARRRREDELRLAAAVFNMADEAMVVTDPGNRIIAVNPAFTAVTGYSTAEAVGHNPSMLSAKSHSRDFYREMWSKLVETGGWSGEVVNRKKTGETYVEWLSIKRVLDEQGQLTHHVAVFSDITARKVKEGLLQHQALHDGLTDLPNRVLLGERLEQAIVRARRNQEQLGLLYFDLDKFKPVNDELGHAIGDQLLVAVTVRLLDCIRESDTVARIGGDEFVVLLPLVEGESDGKLVAEKIRSALAQPFEVAGHTINISASMGLALYPAHGLDAETLMQSADAAMYAAKRSGGNWVALYRAGMSLEKSASPAGQGGAVS